MFYLHLFEDMQKIPLLFPKKSPEEMRCKRTVTIL